jgi:hypothetical protein
MPTHDKWKHNKKLKNVVLSNQFFEENNNLKERTEKTGVLQSDLNSNLLLDLDLKS